MIVIYSRSNQGAGIISGGASPSWVFLATYWDAEPTQVGTVGGDAVYEYTQGGVTRYRRVPATYSPAQDAFFDSFTGGVLGVEVARRA